MLGGLEFHSIAAHVKRLLGAGLGFSAKGDIVVGTGTGSSAVQSVGSEGAAMVADPAQTTGHQYVRLGAGAVRQSVLSAALDANGYNAAITTGSGLRPGLDASPTPMVLAFAAGFGALGAQDLVSTLSADVADPLGANLPASNTSFLHATYASLTSVAWGSTLIPPQYGYAFDRTRGALLNFNGADAAISTTDDFGNTWTFSGNAQLDTAQAKFGTASLLLDGTGDYIKSTSFTSLGDGSWELSCWFRINALPGSGAVASLMAAVNGSGFGPQIRLFNNAGTTRLELYISSDGTTHNVVNGTTGANTTWTLNQWNRVRLVFDALAGTYRAYLSLNGAAETQEISVSSTARACAITKFLIGINGGEGGDYFNGWIDAFRFLPCATNTSAETPSASAPTITDYPVHFFSVPEMKMYEVTSASASADTNPAMTARNRVFVAEADTNASAVTAVRNYALRGEYVSAMQAFTASTAIAFNHNLGTHLVQLTPIQEVTTTDSSQTPFTSWTDMWDGNYGTGTSMGGVGALNSTRNRALVCTGAQPLIFNGTGGIGGATAANFRIGLRAKRAF